MNFLFSFSLFLFFSFLLPARMAHAKNQHSFISFDVLAAAMRFCVFLSVLQKMSDMQFLKLN